MSPEEQRHRADISVRTKVRLVADRWHGVRGAPGSVRPHLVPGLVVIGGRKRVRQHRPTKLHNTLLSLPERHHQVASAYRHLDNLRAGCDDSPEDDLQLREQEGHAERVHPEEVLYPVPRSVGVHYRLHLVLRNRDLSGQDQKHKPQLDTRYHGGGRPGENRPDE